MISKKGSKSIWKIVGVIVLVLLIIFVLYNFIVNSNKISSDRIKVTSESSDKLFGWDENVSIIVTSDYVKINSYSFDGGLNWQDSNRYIATKNGNFSIVVKDEHDRKSVPISYTVNSIDNLAPTIKVSLPSKILLNSKIDLRSNVSVSDDLSGVDGDVVINPSVLDTSTVGQKVINLYAKDKAGNETSIDVIIYVVDSYSSELSNNNEKILYRYRVRSSKNYECNQYDCSYYDSSSTIVATTNQKDTGKCFLPYDQTITYSNGCMDKPVPPGTYCTDSIVTVPRYISTDNYLYDRTYLNKKVSGDGSKIEIDGYRDYKMDPCDSDEVSIDGYCHTVCVWYSKSCPQGYNLIDGQCKKYVNKTCSDTCTQYVWSEWSEWNETSVIPTDEIQVETKLVKK